MRPSHMPKAHVRDYFIIIIAVLFMFVLFLVPVIGLEPTTPSLRRIARRIIYNTSQQKAISF